MLEWLENRIGARSSWRKFLDEPLPAKIGWPHVLGSILLALLAFQFVTGILLSFVYSPSPDGAYTSVRYISTQMEGGAWLRGLHHWGSSLIVIVAGLHLIRTFLYAAYRKPRELTWIAGLLLLLCILAFGQTGYLLPWDQTAYWGTTVTIQIVSTIPVIGPWLAEFIRGGDQVGALTLSRFYSIHAILLPLAISFLIVGHLLLIRRFGITDPWTRTQADGPREKPFYPYQMAKDSFAILIALLLLFFLAWQLETPLGAPADSTDTTFVPRPDWYFLFLFQLLKFFEGSAEVIGTFVIPASVIVVFFLLPWIDRNPERGLRYRKFAVASLLFGIALWGWLTYSAIQETPTSASGRPPGMLPPRSERIKRPSEVGGLYAAKVYCFECHSMTQLGDRPSLQVLSRNRFPSGKEWLDTHLQENGENAALSQRDAEQLMSTLRLISGDRADRLAAIPPKVRFGAYFFYNSSCLLCHKVDGQGGKEPEVPSPDLTFRLLRSKQWHIKHIHDPQSLVKNSKMPPFFHYEPHEYDALAEYILYLHTP